MASDEEIKLGKLVVARGLCTDEQVIGALRERNDDPDGPGLGERLAKAGFFSEYVLNELLRVLDSDEDGNPQRPRHEASTERNISLGSAREAVARECLNEAKSQLVANRDAAIQEIRRLAAEFQDTESGNSAASLLAELDPE